MTLPGHQRLPNSRVLETYVTRGVDEAFSTLIRRASRDFAIRSITFSTRTIFQSARCEFFRKRDPTTFR
jgi:hypothetical protein